MYDKGAFNSKHFWCNPPVFGNVIVHFGDLGRPETLFEVISTPKIYVGKDKEGNDVISADQYERNALMLKVPEDHIYKSDLLRLDDELVELCLCKTEAAKACQAEKNKKFVQWWGDSSWPEAIAPEMIKSMMNGFFTKAKNEKLNDCLKGQFVFAGKDNTSVTLFKRDPEKTDDNGNPCLIQLKRPGTKEDLVPGALVMPLLRIVKAASTESKLSLLKDWHHLYVILPDSSTSMSSAGDLSAASLSTAHITVEETPESTELEPASPPTKSRPEIGDSVEEKTEEEEEVSPPIDSSDHAEEEDNEEEDSGTEDIASVPTRRRLIRRLQSNE